MMKLVKQYKNKDLLKADLVYTSDGGTQNPEIPTINFGVRGVMNFDLTLETACTDNHSGNKGGVTRNPAWDMVQLLSKMLELRGVRHGIDEQEIHDYLSQGVLMRETSPCMGGSISGTTSAPPFS